MGDRENLFENHLVRFFHILRHMGVRISSAETIDALQGLLYADLMDREMVKTTLKATVCKDRESQRIFDQAFESFFVPDEEKFQRLRQYQADKAAKAAELEQAEAELVFQTAEPGEGEDGPLEIKVDLSDEQKDTYTQLPEEEKKKIRDFLQSYREGNEVNDPYDLLSTVVRSQLNFWKRRLEQMEEEKAAKKKERFLKPQYTGDDEFDEILEHIVENIMDDQSFLYEDMRNIAEEDLPKVALLIQKLAKKLATRISRRYSQSQKRRRVDLRRTIRHNIRFGGTMLTLKYKTKKISKPKLLLICDVSGSMARYATFVLQFIYGLASVTERIESFIFAEQAERITPYFTGHKAFGKVMPQVINASQVWGKGTNLGVSLGQAWQQYPGVFTADTVVIVLSDAKTVALDRAEAYLAKVARKVKDIIWLNTLPKKDWADQPQALRLMRYCRMYECYTLAHLERVMRLVSVP